MCGQYDGQDFAGCVEKLLRRLRSAAKILSERAEHDSGIRKVDVADSVGKYSRGGGRRQRPWTRTRFGSTGWIEPKDQHCSRSATLR